MYIKTTYEQDFDDLMMHLKSKYPSKLFDLDGIGSQLDMSKFSKKFFASTVTADASVDANANVDDVSVISYTNELPKPYFKLNSYYILWKELKRLYNKETANNIIEAQLCGDIYIHDFHGVAAGKPYSYHKDTPLILTIGDDLGCRSIGEWFEYFLARSEDIESTEDALCVPLNDVRIRDCTEEHVLEWVNVLRIVRHLSEQPLLEFNCASGESLTVTGNHPMVMTGGELKRAKDVIVGERLEVIDPSTDGTITSITTISDGSEPQWVYDITTESGYFACEGFRVKNCFNYSTYDVMTNGLSTVHKVKCLPPKHLSAFKSQLEQFVVVASNSTLGATGLADLLVVMSYYVKNILETKNDAHFRFADEESCWAYVKDKLTSLVYTFNQPMRASQCVDAETELLTPYGFKKYTELKEGDRVYTINPSTGGLEVQSIQKMNIMDYKGPMYSFKGAGVIKQVVTPNHRVYHNYYDGAFVLTEASQLAAQAADTYERINLTAAPLEDSWPDYPVEDEMLRLIVTAYYEEHGVVDKGTLTKDQYQQVMDRVGGTLEEIPQFFTRLSQRQARFVIGCLVELCEKYYEIVVAFDSQDRDMLQLLGFLAGYKAYYEPTGLNDGPEYVLEYWLEPLEEVKSIERIEDYEGVVWCPTTQNGIVVYRRDGAVFISGNSPFTNVSVYDDNFLEKLKDDYIFPDGSSPDLEVVRRLQDMYLEVMNEELRRTPLTFPVTTACFSVDSDGNIQDEAFLEKISKCNLEFGFINMYCGDSSTLSSCCRLRSEQKSEYFNSFGAGSSKIGSLGVCTVNLPKLAMKSTSKEDFLALDLPRMVEMCAQVNNAKRHIVKRRIENGNEPLYTQGYMELSKQYSTTGVTGLNECISLLGEDILESKGQELAIEMMQIINHENARYEKRYNAPHNVEQIPAENVAVKLVQKDCLLGYNAGVELYSNQFIPLVASANMLERVRLQGMFDKYFSGGSRLALTSPFRLISGVA